MVPDLPYFLPLGIDGPESHSAAGIVWFNLPAGMAAWLVYLLLVRPFALAVLPVPVRRRLDDPDPRLPPASALAAVARAVAVSVLVGATTHVVWDSFTHASGAGVALFPVLASPVPLFEGYAPEVYTLLQHGSSLSGLGLLSWWFLRWYRRTPPKATPIPRPAAAWIRVLAAAVVILPATVTGLLVLYGRLAEGSSLKEVRLIQQSIAQALFSAGTVFIVMLLLAALAWMAARPAGARPGVDSGGGHA